MSFGGRLLIAGYRPFALKLPCFNLMCRWSTISFDSSSALTRLDDFDISFFFLFWELPESMMLCMILIFLHFVLGNMSFPIASPLSICFGLRGKAIHSCEIALDTIDLSDFIIRISFFFFFFRTGNSIWLSSKL